MPRRLQTLLICALLGIAAPGVAEPVVVVNAASGVVRLGHDEVVNIFLGRYRRLSTGAIAQPIDQPERSPLRAEFYRRLVNKDVNQIDAYWSRLIFSGKTAPPLRTASSQEVATLLAGNPDAIAYLERGQVDKRFRIVLELPR
jgi:ABC-type phosphate transport system substrate-binding protein